MDNLSFFRWSPEPPPPSPPQQPVARDTTALIYPNHSRRKTKEFINAKYTYYCMILHINIYVPMKLEKRLITEKVIKEIQKGRFFLNTLLL